jgi:hypothetical protein
VPTAAGETAGPATVCQNCGEEYVDPQATAWVLAMADEAAASVVQVDVRAFHAAYTLRLLGVHQLRACGANAGSLSSPGLRARPATPSGGREIGRSHGRT